MYIAAYVLFVVHFANKGLHDFSVKKVVMLIFFLFEPFSHRVTHIDVLWVHKNKVHGDIVFVLVAHFLVLHLVQVSAISSSTTKGHPVVLSSEGRNFKRKNVVPLWMPYLSSMEYF